jgi:putative heme-binding domain-containing protein
MLLTTRVSADESTASESRPLSAEQSQATIHLADPELKVELVAAEPAVADPVDVAWDADGRMYVVDFYREWVEHPAFVPEHLRDTVDFSPGTGLGRIWRITRKENQTTRRRAPRSSSLDGAQLVKLLEHTNAWWRTTAQRLLVERRDLAVVPALRDTMHTGRTPQSQLHALWTLDGLDALDDEDLLTLLTGRSRRLLRDALRLSEPRLATSPKLVEAVKRLIDDPPRGSRFQLAASMGVLDRASRIRAAVALTGGETLEPWFRLALLGSIGDAAAPLLQTLVDKDESWLLAPSPDRTEFLRALAELVGRRNRPAEVKVCLDLLSRTRRGAIGVGHLAILAGLTSSNELTVALEPMTDYAAGLAASETAPPDQRALAVQLVARMTPEQGGPLLAKLLDARQPDVVQSAAVRAVVRMGEPSVAASALAQWPAMTLATRRQLSAAVLGSRALVGRLVDAIDEGRIAPLELDGNTRDALARLPDKALQARVAKRLTATSADRQTIIDRYRSALARDGDRRRGAGLFAKNCRVCHRVQRKGNRLGPDLTGIAGRPMERLLVDILDPSREVAPDFLNYILITRDESVLTGVLAAETATSVQLRQARDVHYTVLRSDIVELRPSTQSVMPEGFEATLSPQDVTDLLAFLHQPDPMLLPVNDP